MNPFAPKTFLIAAIAATAAVVSSGCASGPKARKQDDTHAPSAQQAQAQGQPSGTSGAQTSQGTQPQPTYGPEPVRLKPVTLIFGPGMARGFAHVGVLRAFAEHKIPIGAIYGSEMGGLMGALYAADSNINTFEWNLLRIKDEVFTSGKSLMGRLFQSGEPKQGDDEKLEEALRKIFGKKDISQAKIPLKIEVQKKAESSPALIDKGSYYSALRAAIADPRFFDPAPLDGQPSVAANDPQSITYLCAEARADSGGPIVLIDTATTRNDPSAADLVIRPNLEGIAPNDFSQKTEAAFRGKKAVEENLAELNRWVGIVSTSAQEGVNQ